MRPGVSKVGGAAAALLFLGLVLAGCLGAGPSGPGVPTPPEGVRTTWRATYWLTGDGSLSPDEPTPGASVRRSLPAGQNAYVNEELDVYRSPPIGPSFVAEGARVVLFFEASQPVVNPFVNQSSPGAARLMVVWAGRDDAFAAYAQTDAPAVLAPGIVYTAEIEPALPGGGLRVGSGGALALLPIATASQQEEDLSLLVGSRQAPSRVELWGRQLSVDLALDEAALDVEELHREQVTIVANSGLFTGASDPQVYRFRQQVAWPVAGIEMARIDVNFVSTTGPKADLDLFIEDGSGTVVASSTTPFQSEHVVLWREHLEALGEGPFYARVDAYSGAQTKFDYVVSVGRH